MTAATAAALPVDVELLVCGWLAQLDPPVDVGTTLVGWTAGQPHVLVKRTGGTVRYGWIDAAEITIEVRAGARQAAADLTARVRALLPAADRSADLAVTSNIVEASGPAWTPDDDLTGAYQMRWTITAHPLRS